MEVDVKRLFRFSLFICVAAALVLAITDAPTEAKKKKKLPADFSMTVTGDQPAAVFSHKIHKEKVEKCTKCHTKIFQMKKDKTAKKKGPLTMAAMEEGKFCGKCHDGKEVFGVKSEEDCVKCHVK